MCKTLEMITVLMCAFSMTMLISAVATPTHALAKRTYDPSQQGCTLQVKVDGSDVHVMSFNLAFDAAGIGFHLTSITGYGMDSELSDAVVASPLTPTVFNNLHMKRKTYKMYIFTVTDSFIYDYEFGFHDPNQIYYVKLNQVIINDKTRTIIQYGLGCLIGGKPVAVWQPKDFIHH